MARGHSDSLTIHELFQKAYHINGIVLKNCGCISQYEVFFIAKFSYLLRFLKITELTTFNS